MISSNLHLQHQQQHRPDILLFCSGGDVGTKTNKEITATVNPNKNCLNFYEKERVGIFNHNREFKLTLPTSTCTSMARRATMIAVFGAGLLIQFICVQIEHEYSLFLGKKKCSHVHVQILSF